MVTIPSAIEQSVARFIAAAQQQQRIVTAYLYGSQVKGTATQWSDIDVALVSPDFAANLFQGRCGTLTSGGAD